MLALSERARAARQASLTLAKLTADQRRDLLVGLADALEDPKNRENFFEANQRDGEAAAEAQARGELAPSLVKRLALNASKLDGICHGIRQLASRDEVVGRCEERRELDEGLILERRSCPLGVLGIVFEARPDALPQITGLALKSGNAVLLKGGSEALTTNRALVACIHEVLEARGLPAAAVTHLEDRSEFRALLEEKDQVDLIIARGSSKFVHMVQSSTEIPVMGHAEGMCHLYLHRDASPEMASLIAVDAKCSYPAACNAIETLLWHREATLAFREAMKALLRAGVELRLCAQSREALSGEALDPSAPGTVGDAEPSDWSSEYSAPILSVKCVADEDEALLHIARYGSGHTEAIVSDDGEVAERFLAEIDAACVFHNASTRFADGYRFGLGAEVGISTGKLHARGPVGVEGLLTSRWLLRGSGQCSADYGPGQKRFTHLPLPRD